MEIATLKDLEDLDGRDGSGGMDDGPLVGYLALVAALLMLVLA